MINYTTILVYFGLAILFISASAVVRKTKKRFLRIPLGFLITYALIKGAIPIFQYADLSNTAETLSVISVIVIWMAVIRILTFFIVDYFLRQVKGVEIPSITRDLGLAISYIIITMIVFKQKTDVNVGHLLTTSAILTAVIGFAMQDTLGNLFSGLAIQMEKPYNIGDWIGFEETVGRVVSVTWKSTKLITRLEEMIFVPNSMIAKSRLTNFSRPTTRHQTSIEIGVSYEDSPYTVKSALVEIMNNHPSILKDPKPEVRIVKYDNFSIIYRALFATDDFATEEKTKCEVLNAIWYKFSREGIRIPYPIQEQQIITLTERKQRELESKQLEEEKIISILDSVDIFSTLSPHIKRELADKIEIKKFAANEIIVSQGEKPGSMYILKYGECRVLVSHDGIIEMEVITLKPGSFFGEISLLTGEPRTATVKALTDVVCYEISKQNITSIFANNPSIVSSVSEVLAIRKSGLAEHKEKFSSTSKAEHSSQIMSKIKAFFGLS